MDSIAIAKGLIAGLFIVTIILSFLIGIVHHSCFVSKKQQKKPKRSPVQKTNNLTKNSQFFLAANINSTVVAFYDNQKLILETNNPEVFFSRYQRALKQLMALAETKKYGINLGNLDPDEIFQDLINKKSEIIDNFIIRSYNHAQNKAAELKTETGKRNRIEKYFTSLEPFKSQMFPQNIQRIEDLRNNLPKDIAPIGISVKLNTESTYPHYPKENQIEDLANGYIHTGNTIQRLDGKPITDADAAYLIKSTMNAMLQEEKQQNRATTFSDEENIFCSCVYKEFQNAKLNPDKIKFTRLASGIFNVDYISEGYLGKFQISKTEEKFRVVKSGAKRASKVFSTLWEAEQYIGEKTGYAIDHKESKNTYYIQYFIGQNPHNDYVNSLDDLIALIPRWVKYVRYMKRN